MVVGCAVIVFLTGRQYCRLRIKKKCSSELKTGWLVELVTRAPPLQKWAGVSSRQFCRYNYCCRMKLARSSGILLHPTSLPSRFGIGDLGTECYRFLDFLYEAKQKLWHVLPLGPTGPENSPYQCRSTFAGNPLLISPEEMVREGYLRKRD